MKKTIDIINLMDTITRPGICPLCGKILEYNPRRNDCGQWAHIIPATIPNYRRYGKNVIDSKKNGMLVCSLRCNNAIQVNPAVRPILAAEVVKKIKEES